MAAPALAQSIRTVDPDSAIDADLDNPQSLAPEQAPDPAPAGEPVDPGADFGPPPADGAAAAGARNRCADDRGARDTGSVKPDRRRRSTGST